MKSPTHGGDLTIDPIMQDDPASNIPPDAAKTADQLFDDIWETIHELGEQVGHSGQQTSGYLAEAQDLLVAFLSAVVVADGTIAQAENDYVNQLFALHNTPEQNVILLRQFYAKWHKVEKRVPQFVQAAVAFDRDAKEGARYSDKLLNLLEQFASCAARADNQFDTSERKIIREYIEMIASYKPGQPSQ